MFPPDPAILSLLSLSHTTNTLTLSPHGSSSFTSTYTLTSHPIQPPSSQFQSQSQIKKYFLKQSSSPSAEAMFQAEHLSLNTLASAVPDLTICPRSYGWGQLSEGKGWFLVTEFIDFSGRRRAGGETKNKTHGKVIRKRVREPLSLAHKLAKLHTAPVPNWDPISTPKSPSAETTAAAPPPPPSLSLPLPAYGFPLPTFCGSTEQPNSSLDSWPEFFSQNRLMAILEAGELAGRDRSGEVRRVVERAVKEVVPRLLGPLEGVEVDERGGGGGGGRWKVGLVHGDLWSGNAGVGRIWRNGDLPPLGDQDIVENQDEDGDEDSSPEPLLFDPSPTYACSEYELGLMKLFGGFDSSFMKEYHSLVPKMEPVAEYDDRVKLYEAYHLLNHWVIFGGSYKSSALESLRGLLGRYGSGTGKGKGKVGR